MKKAMKLIRWAAVGLSIAIAAVLAPAQAANYFTQPAAALADQVSSILGPGQAHLTIRNLSTMAGDAVPTIRGLLERDLKAHGISLAGDEGANAIRVTLSENVHERLWVAEIVEGNTTQVAIVDAGPTSPQHASATSGLTLRPQVILTSPEPVLAALETPAGWIVLTPEQLTFYLRTADGLHALSHVDIGEKRPLPRDPHGILKLDTSETQFTAWLAGAECSGPTALGQSPGEWAVNCRTSDDPWPIFQDPNTGAFYNSARNYFTGVITPGVGADLPAFYAAVAIPRPAGGAALVAAAIDGKALLLEHAAIKPVAGTRDWGSDFAVLRSGCGSGAQTIASSSGQAAADSLRAYELPGLEAIPAGAPLEVNGAVTALWSAPDSRSVLAVVQRAPNQYEVDRVSALCN
jgi:hypothetical protein